MRYAVIVGLVVIGVWTVSTVGTVVLLALGPLSCRDEKSAVQAVTLAWLLTSLNPQIYSAPTSGLRWYVLLTAALGVLWRLGPEGLMRVRGETAWLLIFGGIVVASAFLSSFPALTLLKVVGFIGSVVLIVGLFGTVRILEPGWSTRWFMGVFWAVMSLSAPLVITDLGYVRNARGFQGILNHPQAMGIFLAPFLAALVLVVIKRGPTLSAVVAVMGTGAALYLTEARIGVLAAGIGVTVAVMVGPTFINPKARLVWNGRRRLAVLFAIAVVTAGSLLAVMDADFARDFVLKTSRTEGQQRGIFESRSAFVSDSLSRFSESPLVGTGFGAPRDLDRRTVSTVFGGIPISAPTETGFAITGLLEQVGILGLLSLALFLRRVLTPVFREKDVIAIALVVATLATNLGEDTIASFGGMGLFTWLLIGWARDRAVLSRR